MAKRSKKKNPDVLSNQQREIMRRNQALDLEKGKWDKKLNITVAVVVAVIVISYLLLPLLSMNFTGSLSEFLGDLVTEDETMSIGVDMSTFDFLFAMTKGYSNSIEYIAKANADSNDLSSEIIYNAFLTKVTQEDINMLDRAYIFAFVLCILLLVAIALFVAVTVIKRSKKQDGILFLASVIIFSVIAILQWLFFVAVGIASAGRGQIQPHIGSYLLLAGAVTLCAVYGIYRSKVKKLEAQRAPIENNQNYKDKEIKEEN
ncbi:MAG: hypothetical protein K2L70_02890 [Clostridia bacterium]|nr:hypothetical protein [Clostridia bacterium]